MFYKQGFVKYLAPGGANSENFKFVIRSEPEIKILKDFIFLEFFTTQSVHHLFVSHLIVWQTFRYNPYLFESNLQLSNSAIYSK